MKAPVLALGIATVAFASSSVYLWSQLREERARAAQVETTTREIRQRLTELEKARSGIAAQRSVNAGGVVTGQITQDKPGVALSPPPTAQVMADWDRAPNAAPPKLPASMEKAMRSQIRGSYRQQYADFCEQIGLDQETTEKLIALLSEHDTQMFDGTITDPADLGRQLAQRQRQHEAELAELLGPEKAQAFKEYRDSLPARAEADMLAMQLEGNDLPLNKDQKNRLREVFVEERARSPMPEPEPAAQGDFTKYLEAQRQWQEDYNRRVGDRINHILNTEQLKVYDEIQQWQNQVHGGFNVGVAGPGLAVSTVQAGGDSVFYVSSSQAIAVPAPADPPKKDK